MPRTTCHRGVSYLVRSSSCSGNWSFRSSGRAGGVRVGVLVRDASDLEMPIDSPPRAGLPVIAAPSWSAFSAFVCHCGGNDGRRAREVSDMAGRSVSLLSSPQTG
jgi:hypothetical protein